MIYVQFEQIYPSTKTESVTGAVVHRFEELGKFEVIKYNIADVLELKEKSGSWFIPDHEVMMILRGEAAGCIDFRRISPRDVQSINDTLYIALPQPEICYYKLDMQKTRVYDRSIGSFINQTELVNRAYKIGEERVLQAALEEGILDLSRQNAYKILQPLFEELTKKHVVIQFKHEQNIKPMD
ncbi:hypothetical protein GCM10023331_40000 [Algivirga pacifica]|uniref:DUF4230 domain-containing protein n=1 Tax=Algivirga pacifica TaxID=1162670 RepID=A0ABP9DNE8_9BACT